MASYISAVRLWITITVTFASPFFFQAEDGIRDYKVTGVQTCALPICRDGRRPRSGAPARARGGGVVSVRVLVVEDEPLVRSEERRVGKESRLQGRPDR